MNPELLADLKRCSSSTWFGSSEGSWMGEENVSGQEQSFRLDGKNMTKLKELGYIEATNKVTYGKLGIAVTDWRVTKEGHDAISSEEDKEATGE